MSSETKIPVKNSVATKVLVIVLGLYLVIAVGVTLSHIWMDYRYQKSNIIEGLGDIESAFKKGLAASLWGLDQEGLNASVNGMLMIPTLVGVKISTDEAGTVAIGGIVTEHDETGNTGLHVNLSGLTDTETAVHKGESFNFEMFERQFPIVYDLGGKSMLLGRAIIYSNSSEIYRRMKLQVAMLGINVVLTLITFSLAFLWAISRYLRRPLVALASSTEKVTLENLDSFKVKIKTSGRNELKVLEESFNSMIGNLHLSMVKHKQAEEALLAERQYLTDIIDSLPDTTLIIDTDSRVVVWNRAAEAMTGVKREDLLGKGDYAYAVPFYGEPRPILIDLLNISEKERENSYSSVRRVDDKIYAETFIQNLNDGRGVYLWGVAAPLYDRSGVRIGAIEVIKDITDLKKSEKINFQLQEQLLQAQKIESIGRLAGGVAHDFNNMLGVILGHTELAQIQLDTTQPLFYNLEEIRKAARRSADITRQLLAFARKQTIAPKVIDLNETVDGMLAMLRRLIGEDIHLVWLPGKNLGPVNMDPSQLDQILANLFVNARDAIADTGKVTIETDNIAFDEAYCRIHTGFVPGEYVMLAVSDNGCGMDAETMAHLFEPFFTTKEMGKGTGLGLATIYGIVKQNTGFINVYSEPGQGTTFKIYLPRHGGNAPPAPNEDTAGSMAHGNETILLVEDEPMILEMTTKMLELQGYKVLLAATPGEAVSLAKEHAGDLHLLITDVVMPEMNGGDLARKLLSLYPNLKRLFMSGYTANVIAHHGVLDEGIHFIQKPFSMNDLAAKVREVLDE